MELKELIEKLEAARVLLGDEGKVGLCWFKEPGTWPPSIDRVVVQTDRVFLNFRMTGQ